MNRNSPHKKETIDFLHFITSVEGNTIFFEQSGWLPATREVVVPDEAKVYLPRFDGLPMRTSYMAGLGSETAELWQRQLHHMISTQGSVERFLENFEDEFPVALKNDLKTKTRALVVSLRHDIQALTALAQMDRRQAGDLRLLASRPIRESNQTIAEARLYEALAALALGPAVSGSVPIDLTLN